MATGLTPKQEKFCHLYIQYGDAARAYREAYDSSRMNPATIRRKAVEVMQVPKVSATIRQLRGEFSESMKIDVERTLQELARIAFSDIRQVFDRDGQILPPGQLPENVARAVASFKTRTIMDGDNQVQITEIKFWPKIAALEALSKHLGLFGRDNRQKQPVSQLTDQELSEKLKQMIDTVKDSIREE